MIDFTVKTLISEWGRLESPSKGFSLHSPQEREEWVPLEAWSVLVASVHGELRGEQTGGSLEAALEHLQKTLYFRLSI
jgi:hypothetical protein